MHVVFTFRLLQATAARRAFPCWDEPLLKSTYAITMISRADTVNLSNMPVESEEVIEHSFNIPDDLIDLLASTKSDSDKWKITKFQTTPLMSSYLVAFANGPFEFLETSVVMPLSGKTVPLRIYSEGSCHSLFLLVLMESQPLRILSIRPSLPLMSKLLCCLYMKKFSTWNIPSPNLIH